jgi:hypothetical protein
MTDSNQAVQEATEQVGTYLGALPIVAQGRNCKVRHLKATDPGKRGTVLVEIDLDSAVGPSGSGQNIMIGTMGRNVATHLGTIGVNFWRQAETDQEREALLAQIKVASERAELEAKIKALRTGTR